MTAPAPSNSVAVAMAAPAPHNGAVRLAASSRRGPEVLSRQLGFPVAVIAEVRDAGGHRERLRDLWRASGVAMHHHGWPLPFDPHDRDHREWSKAAIDARWFGGMPHPPAGSVDDGDRRLGLPPGVAPRAVARAFRDGPADLRFEAVARRPANPVCRHHGRRPAAVAVASRYARASAASTAAVEVRDATLLHPRTLRRIIDAAVAALLASADVAARGKWAAVAS